MIAGWVWANKLRALCGVLIVAALAVTLFNTSEFASWYEPTPALAWAWASYVDVAIIGYTLARARNQGDKTVRFAFFYFIGLSLLANVMVTLARYDAGRAGGGVAAAVAASWPFMLATCLLYGASIPISVYTFAHTLADGKAHPEKAIVAHVEKRAPKQVRNAYEVNVMELAQRESRPLTAEQRREKLSAMSGRVNCAALAREWGVSAQQVRKDMQQVRGGERG